MREILFLSGKGGTGKTSLAAAFAVLSSRKVLADCDVDAANLHLALRAAVREEEEFRGSKEAIRDEALCVGCGRCREVCRFSAIGETLEIDPFLCEGCGACVTACPAGALRLVSRVSGHWLLADTPHGPLSTAELVPGEETSGRLVALVKEKARNLAMQERVETLLMDGSPGIGCPVIASVSGAHAVVLVTEPSVSGLHDLDRALGVVRHFGVSAALVVNKADLNAEWTDRILRFASEHELPVLGTIPYDPEVPRRLIEGRSVVEEEVTPAGEAMKRVFGRCVELWGDVLHPAPMQPERDERRGR
ncbi:MAG: ATP-binding protein [Candidatus Bipolaricaulota bacterium]